MQQLFDALLAAAPVGWQLTGLYIGVNWTLAMVQNAAGEERLGLAATPPAEHMNTQSRFCNGFNPVVATEAREMAALLYSSNQLAAAVGLATLNALLKPPPELLQNIDAGDWLVENGRNKHVAMIGRFPLATEVQAVARKLSIFELNPQPGEYSPAEMPQIIPQADILAITSTTLINHTFGGIIALTAPPTQVLLLGPSTPLHPLLFNWGVNLLSGVQIVDKSVLLASIQAGLSFRKMAGVKRVSVVKPQAL